MERLWKVVLVLALVLTCLFTLSTTAQAESEDNYTYTVNSQNTAEIIGFSGVDSTRIVVPSTLGGYTVTVIRSQTYYTFNKPVSITIPGSIKTIGEGAFYNCNDLETVYFCGTRSQWEAISVGAGNDPLFAATIYYEEADCRYTVGDGKVTITDYTGSGGNVTIPSTLGGYPVTIIDSYAFYNCTSLTAVTIPDSVTTVGSGAFYYCTSLTKMTFGGTFAQWLAIEKGDYWDAGTGDYAVCCADGEEGKISCLLEAKEYITAVKKRCQTIEANLASLEHLISGHSAGCNNNACTIEEWGYEYEAICYEYLQFKNTVNSLDAEIFELENAVEINSRRLIKLIDDIAEIEDRYGYSYFEAEIARVNAEVEDLRSHITIAVIPAGVTVIVDAQFQRYSGLTSITIPNSVASIGWAAFRYCENLTSITFEGTVSQWNAIVKGSYWNYNTGAYTIYCTDGEIAKDGTITCKQHQYVSAVTAPTCLIEGYTTYTCHCGDTYVADQVDALGHNFTNYTSNNDATCTKDGTETAKCDRCTETHTRTEEGSAKGHSHEAAITVPTCLIEGYTTYTCHCGDTYVADQVDALGHNFTNYTSNNDGTCTKDGTETAKCDRCMETHTRTEEGSVKGHSYETEVTPATCMAKGYITYTCACGHSFVNNYTDALSHSFTNYKSNEDATCTVDGTETAKCDRCTETHTRIEEGSAKGHSYETEVTPATCMAKGYITYTCACGHSFLNNYTDALSHSFTNYKSNEDATCIVDGTETAKCDRCTETHTRIEEGSAKGHSYETAVTPATCERKGYITYTCVCGNTFASNYTEALAHDYAAATCTKPQICKVCKATRDNALGHSYSNACDTTCNRSGCGATRTITHNYAAATCTKAKTCKVCGKTDGKALGHSYSNACDTSCNRSGCKTTSKISHNYAAATCTKPKTCKVCKATSGKALGHTYKSGSCTRCKYKPAGVKITTQPVNVAVKNGKTATVTVKATGSGLKYTWYYAKKGAKTYTKTNVTSSSYSVKMSNSINGGKVYCVVTDQYGNSVKSNVVTLYKGAAAKITTQPKSTTVANGKTGKLTIKASGSSLKYSWYIKYKGASSFTKVGKSSKTYSFKMASKLDGAQVYCVVKDKYGIEVKSSVVTLKMPTQPKVTTQPVSTKAFSGKTVKFTVKASGDGLKYQWYYAKKGSSSFKKLSAKSATYSVKVSSSVNGRKYYCLVTDKYGQTVKSQVVTLTMQSAAKITTQPKNVSVKNGKTAKLTIKATGDGLKYTWYYLLPGATKYQKASATGNTFSVKMSAQYKNAKAYCVIADQYGNSVKSKTVMLKMK